jgi:hypothetical protein
MKAAPTCDSPRLARCCSPVIESLEQLEELLADEATAAEVV